MKRIVLYDASAIERPTREDLQRLARLRLQARRGGCDLVLTGVGQRLRLLLAVTGLEEVFTISPDGMCGDDRDAGTGFGDGFGFGFGDEAGPPETPGPAPADTDEAGTGPDG